MKRLTDLLKKMDKTKWLILGLSGILLLIVALPVDDRNRAKEDALLQQSLDENTDLQENAAKIYEKQLTKELEQALCQMDGAGEVHVMITFQDNGETVVEKDITKSENPKNSTQYQETTIYQETDGREPYIQQQRLPAVEGVLIIAQGAGDSNVKQDIKDAVMALFPVEAHKIKIVKMQKE